jgi:hypothetical protein
MLNLFQHLKTIKTLALCEGFLFFGHSPGVGLYALAFYKKLLVVFIKELKQMLLSLMLKWFSVEIINNHLKKNLIIVKQVKGFV